MESVPLRGGEIGEAAALRSRLKTVTVVSVVAVVLLCVALAVAIAVAATKGSPNDNDDTAFPSMPDCVLNAVTDSAIRPHFRYLSDAQMQGRLTGSAGEALAGKYIASLFETFGLAPANGDSYYQSVPIQEVTPVDPANMTFSYNGSTVELVHSISYVGSTQQGTANIVLADEELVFVGYGIVSAIRNWDDWKSVNVTGKVVVVLLDQPKTGVWAKGYADAGSVRSVKLDQAASRGAKAVLMMNVGSSWASVVKSQGGTVKQCPSAFLSNKLDLYAWISDSAAEQLAAMCGSNVTTWKTLAESSSFTPFTICANISLNTQYNVTNSYNGNNIVGIVRGTTKPLETVVITGHYDHLGMMDNGTVYTGAIDNAAGSSLVIAAAYAYARQVAAGTVKAKRSILFALVTGEELGLYGSTHLMSNPLGLKFIANINYDAANVWGKSWDLIAMGQNYNTLGTEVLSSVSTKEGITTINDPWPTMGLMFRTDSFSFHNKGIPAVHFLFGKNGFEDPTAYKKAISYMMAGCYHLPCDVYYESYKTEGMIQATRVGLRAAYAVANSDYVPTMLNASQVIIP